MISPCKTGLTYSRIQLIFVRRLMGSTICTYLIIVRRVLMFTYTH
nr:MAG TPA: hypothetical protein [Caudoviricetes sp.]